MEKGILRPSCFCPPFDATQLGRKKSLYRYKHLMGRFRLFGLKVFWSKMAYSPESHVPIENTQRLTPGHPAKAHREDLFSEGISYKRVVHWLRLHLGGR